ncbi:MAG TPA: M50 family metallopeptidase [Bryobacteraceae bacterium]|nr:M50 family metallopeptidase [Bryobacteraceae bacterium]
MPDVERDEKPQPMIPGSIAMLTVFGVPVRLHFTFVLLLVFLLFIGVGGRQSGAMTAIYVLALFASVLLHELGHAVVARRFGVRTLEIVMFPIGGVARLERRPRAREELWIALAGPMVNAVIAAALFGWVAASQGFVPFELLREPTDANLAQRIAVGNLLLFGFNLLPAYPMDGGRILRSLLARWKSEDEATRMAAGAGQILAIAMGLAGLLTGNFLLVFIAMFVYLGAAQENAAVRGRILTTGFPARAAAVTDFQTLSHGQTLRDAGNLLLATSQHDFPVMHGSQVIGLLSRDTLMRAMLTHGPEFYVAGAMSREFMRVAPEEELSEVTPRLAAAGGCALVMDGERLVGMLTSENLSEFILLRQFGLQQARAHGDVQAGA